MIIYFEKTWKNRHQNADNGRILMGGACLLDIFLFFLINYK